MAEKKDEVPRNDDQNPPPNSPATLNTTEYQTVGDAPVWTLNNDDCPRGNDVIIFSYDELAEGTNDFSSKIGVGAFGNVYKGNVQVEVVPGLKPRLQTVAVKKLDVFSHQGDREFLSEVILLSLLRHPNIVNLIGFSAETVDGEIGKEKQRLLVYEFMSSGSLYDNLHDLELKPGSKVLEWKTRMTIALGTAEGLKYLHNEASPCVVFRDLKSGNILLDQSFHPKLSDFGLANFGPTTTADYYATEVKSDVYEFGFLLLELITGRKSHIINPARPDDDLFDWLHPMTIEREKLEEEVDPRLEGKYEKRSLWRAADVALMCLDKDPQRRPSMGEVVEEMTLAASEAN